VKKHIDNTAYIIVPSFAFLFKSLSIFKENKNGKSEESDSSKARKKSYAKTVLYDVFDEFRNMFSNVEDIRLLRDSPEASKMGDCHSSTKIFLSQLISSAIYIRNFVRTKTLNCEVLFCGLSLHNINDTILKSILAREVSL